MPFCWHEFALRSALGAGSSRIVRHVLLEVLSFVPLGVAARVAAGTGLAHALASMLGSVSEPSNLDTSVNLWVFFSSGITVATVLAAGLWPALRVRKVAPAIDMKRSSQSITAKMTGGWIIPLQAAISVTLLVSAVLLGSTFARLYLEPSGFEGRNLVFADVNLRAAKLNTTQSTQAAEAFSAF
jgi:predicted lysophospholipase L1 biosynthesis ABC-type transport system permease subunit